MGFITAMFAMGAVLAPLLVGFSLTTRWGWQGFFLVSGIVFMILTVLLIRTGFEPREKAPEQERQVAARGIYYKGVALLCSIMFVYVGVENGVCFFLNNFMLDTMNSVRGYLALSLFWLAMIPSRFLCGFLAKYRSHLIVAAPLGATLLLGVLTVLHNEMLAFAVVFVLGFFCGGVYPNVLTYVADFAGGKTATITAAITVATGVGATIISASFGFLHENLGFSGAFLVLAGLLGVDIFLALLVPRMHR